MTRWSWLLSAFLFALSFLGCGPPQEQDGPRDEKQGLDYTVWSTCSPGSCCTDASEPFSGFNCHGFAHCRMRYPGKTDAWYNSYCWGLDPAAMYDLLETSYVSVWTEEQPFDVVAYVQAPCESYMCMEHTAVRLSSGSYRSKHGYSGPLVDHPDKDLSCLGYPTNYRRHKYSDNGPKCGDKKCDGSESFMPETYANCPTDCPPPPSCTEGTYKINNDPSQPLYTVNGPLTGGASILVTMNCGGTWTLYSGSCPGWTTNNGGKNMSCYMSWGSASWRYTNSSTSRSITFYHQ